MPQCSKALVDYTPLSLAQLRQYVVEVFRRQEQH
jgi:hypothetical protein